MPEELTQCNCSICRRYGVQWIYFKSKEVKIFESDKSKAYIWGDKEIAFHHCKNCGCVTHYTSLSPLEFDRTAINANLLEPSLIKNLKIRKFNGADM